MAGQAARRGGDAPVNLQQHFRMALAGISSQNIDGKQTQKILDKKMNKAKRELVKLQQSYDAAVDDIQKHYSNASAALTAIKEEALKALDTYMLEYQKRLRKEMETMRELQESLSSYVLNDKMHKDSLSEDDSMGMTSSHDQAVARIIEIYVETVPSFRFLGNEAFLFQVINGSFLPYFGCITVDNKLLATDLHLLGTVDPFNLCYTFRIDVPNGVLEIEDLESKIKCQLYEKERGGSVSLTPVWVTDHFEIKMGFPKKTAFCLGVYFLEQHITGSPVNYNLDSGTLQTANSDMKDMEVVKPSAKRTLGMPDSLIEAALHEVNTSIDTNNNSSSINNNDNSKSSKNNTDISETNLLISGRTCKISKRTRLPFCPTTIKSVQPLFEVPKASHKESVTSTQDSGVSCSSPVSQEEIVTQTQEKQGVQPVIKYEIRPRARPLPCAEEEPCCIPVHKVDPKCCLNPVAKYREQKGSEKKQSTLEQPIETTTDCFGEHENLSRKICFPNKFISHTFHPGVCRNKPRRKGASDEDFARVLARLTKSSWRKQADSETDEDVLVEEEVSCYGKDIPFPEEELVKQDSLNGEDMLEGHAPGNLMINTMAFNAVEAKLSCVTSIEAPFNLNRPVGVLEHSSGNIIVSDTFNDRVLILNNDGAPIGLAGPSMGFRRPSSVVELWDGSFAVICSNFIAVFDAEGTYTKILGKNLLQKPYGLSLTEDGKLLTVETAYLGCLIIVTICPELKLELSRLRVPLQLPTNQEVLSKPRFTASYKDKIYVGDLGLNCIYEVNYTSGCLLSIFGSTGSEPGCLIDPSGITCDPNGNIFVADSRNHRIQVFDDCKRFICIIDVDYPLNRPSGIYLARSDHLLVLNYWENSVAKYQLTYKFM
ncbi:uncharacterized protein LOC135093243 isoform X2 [Scylla paramamosain]|uniref:uncharacterized protein LOC135093243 isoform X2 n=1 Tax=Scylla paramamosain TaxID=85552 RepID=UPI003083ABBE